MNTTHVNVEELLDKTEKSDEQFVMATLATGNPIPPDVAARVRERARKIRERVFQEHGLLDIAVSTIREFRDR